MTDCSNKRIVLSSPQLRLFPLVLYFIILYIIIIVYNIIENASSTCSVL
jgi:hypothetical protein